MNSWQCADYYEYVKERFLISQNHVFALQTTVNEESNVTFMKNYLNETFSVDVDSASFSNQLATLIVNKDQKSAFTINYGFADFNSEKYKAIEKSSVIETIYSFTLNTSTVPSTPVILIKNTPKSPFVDVSHHLQRNAEDPNCVLYSMNFVRAMSQMLKQPERADHVFQLACSAQNDPIALESLVYIFREDLKTYLPCYYDITTGTPRANAELEIFHLHQRWEMGAKSLSIFHPLEEETCDGLVQNACNDQASPTLVRTIFNIATSGFLFFAKKGGELFSSPKNHVINTEKPADKAPVIVPDINKKP